MFCVRLWTCGSRERGRGEGKPSPGHGLTRLDPTRGSTDLILEQMHRANCFLRSAREFVAHSFLPLGFPHKTSRIGNIATGPVSTCFSMATFCCSAVVLKCSKCECMRGGFKERTVTLQIWPEEML